MEKKVFFRPFTYFDDGTDLGWGDIEGLKENQVFEDRADLEVFMESRGFDSWDYDVREISEDELDEDAEIIDFDGTPVDGTIISQ